MSGGGLDEFIDEENRFISWGGRDTWQYVWEPLAQNKPLVGAESTDLMRVAPENLLEFTQQSAEYMEAYISIENISGDRIAYKVCNFKIQSPQDENMADAHGMADMPLFGPKV